jgi:hypothetical protein
MGNRGGRGEAGGERRGAGLGGCGTKCVRGAGFSITEEATCLTREHMHNDFGIRRCVRLARVRPLVASLG